MELVIGAALLWVLPCFIAYSQGESKNRAGLAYGTFLGWIGVLCLALLPPAKSNDEKELAKLEQQLRLEKLRSEYQERRGS
jgi:hypothetical protein